MAKNRLAAIRKRAGVTLERLEELTGIAASTLSRMQSGEREMSVEHAQRLAPVLKSSAAALLGLTNGEHSIERPAAPGLAEPDAERYVPPPGSFLTASNTTLIFRMKGAALDQATPAILAGDLVVFDATDDDPARISPFTIVVAQLYDRHEFIQSHGTVIRLFMPPDKLITNSSGPNEIFSLNDPSKPFTAAIRGTFRSIVRGMA